jgi:hypothetical protein
MKRNKRTAFLLEEILLFSVPASLPLLARYHLLQFYLPTLYEGPPEHSPDVQSRSNPLLEIDLTEKDIKERNGNRERRSIE